MVKLGDVVRIEASKKQIPGNAFWLLNLDMVEQQTGKVIDYIYVDQDGLNGSIVQFDTDCVLYSKLRPNLNKVVLPTQDGFATSEMLPLRPCTNLLTREYLAAFLRSDSFVTWAVSKTAGAKMPRLGTKELLSKEIPLPGLAEQNKIAQQFAKVDELVTLRKEQLAKLEQLVKARFVEMFGTENDFARWPRCTVGDVSDVCVGVVIKPTQYYTEQGIPAFRSLNIGEMYVKDNDWVYFTEEGHRKNHKSVIHANDVLVVRSGAPGTACVATEEYAGYNAVDIIIARPNTTKIHPVFLAAFTNMPHGMNQIKKKTGGAAQQHFNVGGYKALQLILPPMKSQQDYAAFIEETNKTKLTIQASLDKLEVMKKALMQEYLG